MVKSNEKEAKVPDHEGLWSAIDIFLFSNGQEYSPPRKYHLTAQELNWWDSTLVYLARSHYGSLHSCIELYTIDGHKIESPLDLGDGMHYVAVVPPDAFIDSGYEKYLIKASRSWEKRQAKRMMELQNKPEIGTKDCTGCLVCCPCLRQSFGVVVTPIEANTDENGPECVSPKKVDIESAARDNLNETQETQETQGTVESGNEDHQDLEKETTKEDDSSQLSTEEKDSDLSPTTAHNSELNTIKISEDIAVDSYLTKPLLTSTPRLDTPEMYQLPEVGPASPTAPQRPSIIRNSKKRLSEPLHPSFVKTVAPHKKSLNKAGTGKNKETLVKKVNTKIPVKANNHLDDVANPKRNMPTHFKKVPPPLIVPVPAPTIKDKSNALSPPLVPPTLLSTLEDHSLVKEQSPTLQRITSIPNNNTFIAVPILQDQTPDQDVIVAKVSAKVLKITSDFGYPELDESNLIPSKGVDETVSCYIANEGTDQVVQTEIKESTETGTPCNTPEFYNISKIKVIPTAHNSQNDDINCKIPLEDSYIAVINKGDAVKINLNIELQNGKISSKTTTDQSKNFEMRKVRSLSNVFKKIKSQSQNDDVLPVESKSLQSVLSAINEYYTKVLVVQCSRCGNNSVIPRVDTMPVFRNDNGFFILIPGPTPTVTQSSGSGPNNEKDKPLEFDKKLLTELCQDDMKPKTESIFPCMTQDVGVLMTVVQNGFRPRQDSSNSKNVFDPFMHNKQGCINVSRGVYNESLNELPSLQTEKNEFETRPKVSCNAVDAVSQTDWCCLLMQVKHHDDNHYSFHLPPLELVKYYERGVHNLFLPHERLYL